MSHPIHDLAECGVQPADGYHTKTWILVGTPPHAGLVLVQPDGYHVESSAEVFQNLGRILGVVRGGAQVPPGFYPDRIAFYFLFFSSPT